MALVWSLALLHSIGSQILLTTLPRSYITDGHSSDPTTHLSVGKNSVAQMNELNGRTQRDLDDNLVTS